MDRSHPQDRWLITGAGRQALLAARNWVFEVDEISHEKGGSQEVLVAGRLIAGSMAFFADEFSNSFTIARDEADAGIGWVKVVWSTYDSAGACDVVVSLERSEEDQYLRHGDLLRFREVWVG